VTFERVSSTQRSPNNNELGIRAAALVGNDRETSQGIGFAFARVVRRQSDGGRSAVS